MILNMQRLVTEQFVIVGFVTLRFYSTYSYNESNTSPVCVDIDVSITFAG